MRRKDRERDVEFAVEVIKQCEYGTLAMINGDGKPYCVPVSPVALHGAVYFHSAMSGEKCECIAQNSEVCLSCACEVELLPQKFTAKYKSAVVFGKCEIVADEKEKVLALTEIAMKYAGENLHSAADEIRRNLDRTAVYKILPTKITGKGNL